MPVSLSGSVLITGSITTSGTITAQTLVVQTITSSIVNMTGSNIFGSQLTDRQTFTGSMFVTGSITSFAGAVAIGTGSASNTLHILGTSDQQLKIDVASGSVFSSINFARANVNAGALAYNHNSNAWQLPYTNGVNDIVTVYAGGAERMRINNSGSVGIAVTPSVWNSAYSVLQVGSTGTLFSTPSNTILGQNIYINPSDSNTYLTTNFATQYRQVNGQHIWYTSPSGTAGTAISFTASMALTAGGTLYIGNTSGDGRLYVKTSTAVSYSPTVYTGTNASIRLETGGTPATNITTGISMGVGGAAEAYIGAVQNSSTYADIVFQSYNGSYGERMRITSTGQVVIGSTSAFGSCLLGINGSSVTYNLLTIQDSGTTYSASNNFYLYFLNSTGGAAGGISHNAASTVNYYTGPSDLRLKSNINTWNQNVLDLFKNINPVTYELTRDADGKIYKGFIAQDMVDKFPEAYGKDKEGYYTFNPDGYIVYLVKAIQELSAKVTALENK